MTKETKRVISQNTVAVFFSLVILAVVIIKDVTNTELSNLYIVLPAFTIIGESIRQIITRK